MSYLTPLLEGGVYHFLWIAFWFVIVLTVLVFVHEFGHYWIARRNDVKVEVFSIGFGPELFGWWDRAGTRWKFSAIPLGGYVKMFGDADASSGLPIAGLSRLSPAEWAVSFHGKRLGQRAAIVAGGPAANFVFAVVILALLFMTYGQPFTPAEVGQVQPSSAAEAGGIHPGDLIVSIDARASDELGGPLRIAQMSGEVAQGGIVPLLWFMAVLSINLGLINLFPVPVLDGGHLLFYAAEAIRGKPLGQRAQEYGFRVGLALVLTLMVFATWNDLVHTGIVDIVKRFVT